MSDDAHTPATAGATPAGSAMFGGAQASAPLPTERPEVVVGAAFAGGLIAALILKRVGSHD